MSGLRQARLALLLRLGLLGGLGITLATLGAARAAELVGAWAGGPVALRSIAKNGLGTWDALLGRSHTLLLALAVATALGLPGLLARRRGGLALSGGLALALALGAAVLVPHGAPGGPVLTAGLVLLAWGLAWLLGRRPGLALVPGTGLLAPAATLGAALGPRGVGLGLALALPWGLGLGLGLDAYRSPRIYDPGAAEPGAWPLSHLDPRIQRVEQAAPGVDCEYHDVDLIDNAVVVVAEGSQRLLAFSLDGKGPPQTGALPAPWGPTFGLVLDSLTDPRTGLTWALSGPQRLQSWRLSAQGWRPDGPSVPLVQPEDHAYLALIEDRNELAIVHVNAATEPRPGWINRVELAPPYRNHVVQLQDETGRPLPTPRTVTWVPSLERLVLTSEFGEGVWLVDPQTGRAERALDLSTTSAMPLWVPELDRLFLPQPASGEVLVVDLQARRIERRIPGVPGVRSVAVDVDRDLLLAASTLTGEVRVHRLSDGATVDHFTGMMPLPRELVLDTKRGVAWLSTWGALYRFPYAAP